MQNQVKDTTTKQKCKEIFVEEDGFSPKSSAPYRSRADFPQEMFTASGAEDFDRVTMFAADGAEEIVRVTTFTASGAEEIVRVTMFAASGVEDFDRVTMFARLFGLNGRKMGKGDWLSPKFSIFASVPMDFACK